MRKILAAVMAILITASVCVTAFAADGGSVTGIETGEKTFDVTANYQPSGSAGTVYNVDITWGKTSFTYTDSGRYVWNANTHTYSPVMEGKWSHTTADITVVNHSEIAINVAVSYTPAVDTGVNGTIVNGTATLQAVTATEPEKADRLTATLKISGKPNSTVTVDGIKIGTVTIAIS